MAQFNQRLIEWTNMKEEKQYTFTITDEDVKRPRSGPQLKSISRPKQSTHSSEGNLRKYHALPPIGSSKKPQKKKASSASQQGTPSPPIPPEPSLLHLRITARTHSIKEFHKNFTTAVDNFCIDQ